MKTILAIQITAETLTIVMTLLKGRRPTQNDLRPMSWMRIIPCRRERTPTSENYHGCPDYCRDIIDHCDDFVERASPCSE